MDRLARVIVLDVVFIAFLPALTTCPDSRQLTCPVIRGRKEREVLREWELIPGQHSLRFPGNPAVLGKSRRPVALRPCLSTGLPFSVGENALDKSDFAYRFETKYRRFERNDCDWVNTITVPDIRLNGSVTRLTKKPVACQGFHPGRTAGPLSQQIPCDCIMYSKCCASFL